MELLDGDEGDNDEFQARSSYVDSDASIYDPDTLLGAAIKQQHTTSLAILQRLLNEIENPNIVVQGSSYNLHRRETALLLAIETRYTKSASTY